MSYHTCYVCRTDHIEDHGRWIFLDRTARAIRRFVCLFCIYADGPERGHARIESML